MALRHIRMPWLPHSAASGEQGWSRDAVLASWAAMRGTRGKSPAGVGLKTSHSNTPGVGTELITAATFVA